VQQRRPHRYLSVHKRFVERYSLSSNEQVRARRIRKATIRVATMIKFGGTYDAPTRRRLVVTLILLSQAYNSMFFVYPARIERLISLGLGFSSFDESQVGYYYKLRKDDLIKLFSLLEFEQSCVLNDRSRMKGEEVFLRGYFELRNGIDQYAIADLVFGGHQGKQSHAFIYFVNHMYERWSHLVTNNLWWWFSRGWMRKSRDAITAKMTELTGVAYESDRDQPICSFIDCNALETCRVMHCAVAPGQDAQRWEPAISEAFYNGWKSNNGLKFQTVDNAFGMTEDSFGPESLRNNDNHLLGESDIVLRMISMFYHAFMQANPESRARLIDFANEEYNEFKMAMMGDSAYRYNSGVLVSYHSGQRDQRKRDENYSRKVCRESIEWNYGSTAAKFQYLTNLKKLKVMGGHKCLRVYTVALVLKNCSSCLYGNQTSNYFNVVCPTLEEYLHQL
jgi:nuclease HARBI1